MNEITYDDLFLSSVLKRGFALERFLRAWMAKAEMKSIIFS